MPGRERNHDGRRAASVTDGIQRLGLDNVTLQPRVPPGSLPVLIAQAEIGLGGPSGNTAQAHRVVTAKTLQFLAMGQPVIIRQNEAAAGFEGKVNCFAVPQGSTPALADAIYWAFHHRTELSRIGWLGCELYRSRYSPEHVGRVLERILLS